MTLLSTVEKKRQQLIHYTDADVKSNLGQFLTPEPTAAFMAGLFPDSQQDCHLLDAGAGIGALSAAFLDRWQAGALHFRSMVVDAFEIDRVLIPHLNQTFDSYRIDKNLTANVYNEDFVTAAVNTISGALFTKRLPRYTHAILNPPYKKIGAHSEYRLALRHAGIETVNLYAAFVALAVALAQPGAQIVAIIPRSFCNGPYYRSFRKFILERSSIRRIHLFGSRSKAFKDEAVLQENIILRLECGAEQGAVKVSTSTDDAFSDLKEHLYTFDRIVKPTDPEQFIHVPLSHDEIELSMNIQYSLMDIGIMVSTGPIVDFRLKQHLRGMPESGTVPLLYSGHFRNGTVRWPIDGMKKPNAILHNEDTNKWLLPNGYYCVVRRFSSKEEKRRVVASVVNPHMFGRAALIGIENHLNVFHDNKHALPDALATGLAAYLNTKMFDESFRCFSGHTQVNATDLRQMRYPSRNALIELGRWVMEVGDVADPRIEQRLEGIVR